jgi:hypothetical protein
MKICITKNPIGRQGIKNPIGQKRGRGESIEFCTIRFKHRNKYMEEKFHSKKFSHSHRVSISFQCIRPEFRSVLLSFFLCGISLPYIYFYGFKFLNQGESIKNIQNTEKKGKKLILPKKIKN